MTTGGLFDADFERRLEGLSLSARRLVEGRLRAERRSRRVGAGLEFADHREYVPGDDVRFLDIPLFARSQKLFIKLYEEEADLAVHILVDVSRSMSWAREAKHEVTKLMLARRVAAALAFVSLSGLDRVSVAVFSDDRCKALPLVRGKARVHRVLEFLASEDANSLGGAGVTNLAAAMEAFAAQTRARGLVILLSDFYSDELERSLDRLRHARFEVVALQVWDPRELEKIGIGDFTLVDRETGERRDVTVTSAMQARYLEVQSLARARLAAMCRQKQIRYLDLSLDEAWDDAALRVLMRGGLVG